MARVYLSKNTGLHIVLDRDTRDARHGELLKINRGESYVLVSQDEIYRVGRLLQRDSSHLLHPIRNQRRKGELFSLYKSRKR